jgi:Icc-related predicted phosphoesterase
MKILCVSDQIDPLVYSSSIKERFSDVDVVLSAGDLPMDYLGFIVTCLNKPLLFVFGNHNLKEFAYYRPGFDDRMRRHDSEEEAAATASGAIHIGSRVRRESGVLFAGLGGSIMYNKGKNQFTNFQMNLEIIRMIPRLLINKLIYGRFLDILLTHAPPEGIHDKDDPCHRGFKAFLWFMRTFKPRYLIHGHIHLYDLNDVRTTRYGDTLVVNAYSHYLIDTGDRP